jgi:hypothetical protein
MSVNTLSAMDCNASVKAADGCIYFLNPWVDTTTTGKSAYTLASSVDLVKFNPATLAITRINVDVSVVSNTTIRAFSLSLSPDGNSIHIFWSGLVTTNNRKFNYKKYNVVAGTMGSLVSVVADLSAGSWYVFSSITNSNGDIYCAAIVNGNADYVYVYKSTNDGTSFSLDNTITITGSNCDLAQLSLNKAGNVVLAYITATNAIYTVENNSGVWGTAIAVGAVASVSSMKMVSTSDTDYIFFRDTTTNIYAYYLSNGVWTLITTIASVQTWPITAIATKNNTVVLLYTVGTTFTSMEFSGSNYSSAITMTASLSPSDLAVCPAPTEDDIYVWVRPNANPSLWKPYKISIVTMTGTYPLEIKCFDANGSALVYESLDTVASPDFKPFEGTPPMRGMIKSGYVEISASGKLHMNNIETIIKPIY